MENTYPSFYSDYNMMELSFEGKTGQMQGYNESMANGEQGLEQAKYIEQENPELFNQGVAEHAKFLGIDPVYDKEFLWIARDSLIAPVPEGWRQVSTSTGAPYYYNESTGESRWEHPSDQHFIDLFHQLKKKKKESNATYDPYEQGYTNEYPNSNDYTYNYPPSQENLVKHSHRSGVGGNDVYNQQLQASYEYGEDAPVVPLSNRAWEDSSNKPYPYNEGYHEYETNEPQNSTQEVHAEEYSDTLQKTLKYEEEKEMEPSKDCNDSQHSSDSVEKRKEAWLNDNGPQSYTLQEYEKQQQIINKTKEERDILQEAMEAIKFASEKEMKKAEELKQLNEKLVEELDQLKTDLKKTKSKKTAKEAENNKLKLQELHESHGKLQSEYAVLKSDYDVEIQEMKKKNEKLEKRLSEIQAQKMDMEGISEQYDFLMMEKEQVVKQLEELKEIGNQKDQLIAQLEQEMGNYHSIQYEELSKQYQELEAYNQQKDQLIGHLQQQVDQLTYAENQKQEVYQQYEELKSFEKGKDHKIYQLEEKIQHYEYERQTQINFKNLFEKIEYELQQEQQKVENLRLENEKYSNDFQNQQLNSNNNMEMTIQKHVQEIHQLEQKHVQEIHQLEQKHSQEIQHLQLQFNDVNEKYNELEKIHAQIIEKAQQDSQSHAAELEESENKIRATKRDARAQERDLKKLEVRCNELEAEKNSFSETLSSIQQKLSHSEEEIHFAEEKGFQLGKQQGINEMINQMNEMKAEKDRYYDLYSEELKKRRQLHNRIMEIQGNIRVFCRVRPVQQIEENTGEAGVVIDFPRDDQQLLSLQIGEKKGGGHHSFEFDHVFQPLSTQEEVFAETKALIVSAMDGYNICIFAYGQTGSGKTFTMEGQQDNPGVNFRAVQELFRIRNERVELGQIECIMKLSMLEVYNETVVDLLSDENTETSRKTLEVRLGKQGTFVENLIEVQVFTEEDVEALMSLGHSHRSVGSHNANEHSSRSHLVLCITMEITNILNNTKIFSKLNLIDLAGSERISKTAAAGQRLKEAQNINRSLSALGDVIAALGNNSKHIPYRNSKLTFILQDSLSGNSKVLMFVHVSPVEWNASESLCSLNFASRCRTVELGQAKVNTSQRISNSIKKDNPSPIGVGRRESFAE